MNQLKFVCIVGFAFSLASSVPFSALAASARPATPPPSSGARASAPAKVALDLRPSWAANPGEPLPQSDSELSRSFRRQPACAIGSSFYSMHSPADQDSCEAQNGRVVYFGDGIGKLKPMRAASDAAAAEARASWQNRMREFRRAE